MADPSTSAEWMARATEARNLAEKMHDADPRFTMLAIAAGYEKLAKRAEVGKTEAPATSTDIYRSSNGDRWRLISDSDTGRRLVRHEPNRASGGPVTEVTIEEFLAVNGPGPETRLCGESSVAALSNSERWIADRLHRRTSLPTPTG
jgi:hypothetical protein